MRRLCAKLLIALLPCLALRCEEPEQPVQVCYRRDREGNYVPFRETYASGRVRLLDRGSPDEQRDEYSREEDEGDDDDDYGAPDQDDSAFVSDAEDDSHWPSRAGRAPHVEPPSQPPRNAVWLPPVREIPTFDLNDISMASFDQWGAIIYYNPSYVAQVGPEVSAFFRAHEYGHIYLRHIQREYFDANPYNRAWIRRGYELEADQFAARILSRENPAALEAAIRFFERPMPNSWDHPSSPERAAVLREYSNR